MLKPARILILIFSLSLTASCEKNENSIHTGLEFYLLKDFQADDHMKIYENTAVIADTVLIKYESIISYDKNKYSFKLTDSTIHYSSREYSPLLKQAFAVTIDKEIIYTGYFWSGFYSQICTWFQIDLVKYEMYDELIVDLFYIVGDTITDNRNDERILELLRNDNRLIE